MKFKLDKKYIQLGITIFFTSLALLLVFFIMFRLDSFKSILSKFNSVLLPITYGLIFSYLMTPLLNTIEKKILYPLFYKINSKKNKQINKKNIRRLSVLLTIIIVLLLIYLFFASLIPQVYSSLQHIINNYDNYVTNLTNFINNKVDTNPNLAKLMASFISKSSTEADNFLTDVVSPMIQKILMPNINDLISNISLSLAKIIKVLYSFIIGIIISLYVLAGKEKFAENSVKACYAFLEIKTANRLIESMRFIHRTFIGFLSGKVVDSAIIGIICYICALVMKLPYPVLIGVIVGVTNIIPFFGPYFGAIPSALIILMVDPKKALYFIIMILILQQVDGNFIGPKILSGSTGLNSFWIIFAITLFGGFFGVFGMVIGVPITAVILTGLNKLTEGKLIKKELPIEIENYHNLGEISENKEFIKYVYVKPEKEKKNNFKTPAFIIKIINKFKKKS
ncbi:MAG: AI-2E family transporter [Firmicutes bacterium]|nr:AI-2E family transporter [Candidatus Colivicinus equi]